MKSKRYDVLREHNYFCEKEKETQNYQMRDVENSSPDSTIILNNNNIPDSLGVYHSSAVEDDEDLKHKSLNQLLKLEYAKDLVNEKNMNSHNTASSSSAEPSSFISHEKSLLNNTNTISTEDNQHEHLNHSLVRIDIPQNNSAINETCSDSDEQDTFNIFVLPESVCPPWDWVNLIYLSIKNSTTEYVTCRDVEKFTWHWFPFYREKPLITFFLTTFLCDTGKYFITMSCNGFTMWTVKNEFVNVLEDELMSIVYNYEEGIKSAMKYPDQLPTLLKGYGLLALGHNQNINI